MSAPRVCTRASQPIISFPECRVWTRSLLIIIIIIILKLFVSLLLFQKLQHCPSRPVTPVSALGQAASLQNRIPLLPPWPSVQTIHDAPTDASCNGRGTFSASLLVPMSTPGMLVSKRLTVALCSLCSGLLTGEARSPAVEPTGPLNLRLRIPCSHPSYMPIFSYLLPTLSHLFGFQ